MQVVDQMAIGVSRYFRTNIGIGISGISGPDGETVAKTIGDVCISIAYNGNIIKNKKYNFNVSRLMHREISTLLALNMLRTHYYER